jgi:hypothetical protein
MPSRNTASLPENICSTDEKGFLIELREKKAICGVKKKQAKAETQLLNTVSKKKATVQPRAKNLLLDQKRQSFFRWS